LSVKLLSVKNISLFAVEGFEWGKLSFFRLARQILQSKSGIFGEKFNKGSRKKDFLPAKGLHSKKAIGLDAQKCTQKSKIWG